MIMTRSHAIATAVATAAVLTATGITYATAVPAPQAQAQAQVAADTIPAQTLMGGEGGNNGKGNEGNERRGNERGGNEREGRRHYEGRIHINEREYSGRPDGCITVVSGLGAKSFNIRNESRNEVEVFRGAVCDNGAPIATVGPRSSANNVRPGKDEDENFEKGEDHGKKHHEEMNGGVKVKNGVIASFRVVKRHHGERGEGGEGGDFGDFGDY
ncbi:hypothetical protein OG306_39540 [Streptomyces sp. NBC_01241]|uniref:hypothetical protein n=1 Tax=Streptomyces sp. NBC_01241 TaxID=2903794 RepID=UPI00352CFF32|nr:hypothetical protein OG306_39540 [Streptomyces sp. NBC_01241]